MARLMAMSALAVVLAMLAIAGTSVRAEPSPPGSCNGVLSDCAGDIAKALSALGVRNPSDLGKVPQDKLRAFTSDPKNKPSGACCKAACEGNRQNCNCYQAVQTQIKGLVGGDLGPYLQLLNIVGGACGFSPINGGSCPSDLTKITAPGC